MRISTALCLLLLAVPAGGEEGGFSVEPRVETSFGSDGYNSVDAEARFTAPLGFAFTFGYNTFDDDSSTRAFTRRFQLEREWDNVRVSLLHSRSPVQNSYESTTWGFGAAVHNGGEDFRTEAGFDAEIVHHGLKFRINRDIHAFITQRYVRARVEQRLWKTVLSAELGMSSYVQDVPALLGILASSQFKNTISFSNAIGVVSGFPDTTQDYRLEQELGEWPVSLWTSYSNVQLVTRNTDRQRTSDGYAVGVDAQTSMGLGGGLSYRYIRQTASPITRLYSFSLSWFFG